jgi:hypothetical protein
MEFGSPKGWEGDFGTGSIPVVQLDFLPVESSYIRGFGLERPLLSVALKTIFRVIYSWAGSLYALTNNATVIAT